jgi:type IV pilus assembly protein PilM
LNLRPAYPPVAIEIDRGDLTLVRIRAKDRARPYLEAYHRLPAADVTGSISMLRPQAGSTADLAKRIKDLFLQTGTKPGKVSLILPDNLAKLSIVTLPERPRTRKQLLELLRFKLRRSVPFRLEDAVLTSTVLPGPGPETNVLVAVMLRSVVEQYEAALEAAGGRPGLVDLCTPSLFNLVRRELLEAAAGGSDAALLNCTRGYFTLIIVRGTRVVFFRCKSYAHAEDADPAAPLAMMARELASSISYYQEKLAGTGIGTLFVRAVSPELHDVIPVLERLGIASIRGIDPAALLDPSAARRLDATDFVRLAPALGAAAGRAAA